MNEGPRVGRAGGGALARRAAVLGFLWLVAVSSRLWAGPCGEAGGTMGSEKELREWTQFYYLHPAPDKVVPAVRFLSRARRLNQKAARAPFVAFFGVLFRQNKECLSRWAEEFVLLPGEQRKTIWDALWFSGTDEANAVLKRIAARLPDGERRHVEGALGKPPDNIGTMPLSSPEVLDMLWGTFFATGDKRYVNRIIEAIHWSEEKGDMGRFLIGGAAHWSLKANAFEHEAVLSACELAERTATGVKKRLLAAVVSEARARRRKPEVQNTR